MLTEKISSVVTSDLRLSYVAPIVVGSGDWLGINVNDI